MKVLLTGASGQLGKEITFCKPKNVNLLSPNKLKLNLENPDHCKDFITFEKPDWVINCGAYTNVDNAEINKEQVFKINSKAPDIFSKELEKNGGKLLQISTDYIFDGNGNTPYNINANSNPQNIYGKSKDLAEKSIRRNFSHQNKFIILRTSWVMSPYGKNFLLTMVNLLKTKSYIEVIDDQIGSMTYTKNLAKVCWQLIETNKEYELKNRNFPSTHHWCEKGITTWFNIACVISQICKDIGLINNPAEIRPVKTIDYKVNAKRPKYSVLNCEETERLLNIKSANWEKSLFDILLELKNNSI